jgi:hypothetical protein
MSDLIQAVRATTAPRRNRITPTPEPLTVNLHGASVMTGLGKRKLQELVADGTVRSTLAGGRRLLFVDSIMELLNSGAAD